MAAYSSTLFVRYDCGCIGFAPHHCEENDDGVVTRMLAVILSPCDCSDPDDSGFRFNVRDMTEKDFAPLTKRRDTNNIIQGISHLIQDGERFRVIQRSLGIPATECHWSEDT